MFNGMKVVLTTGSMNRLAPLRRALDTWVQLTEVDMILVVDWGSEEPLREALRDIRDPRLNILRVVGEKHWCNSKCHNLEFRMASNAGLILRLDNDTLIQRNFFTRHPADPNGFYAVNWRTVPIEVDDKRNLAGTLLIEPKFLWSVNGYNERLVYYGKEDDDLYDRLVALGLKWHEIDLKVLEHIRHDDRMRYENLAVASTVGSLISPEHGERDVRLALIAASEHIVRTQPWTITDRMSSWDVAQAGQNYWVCRDGCRKTKENDVIFANDRSIFPRC